MPWGPSPPSAPSDAEGRALVCPVCGAKGMRTRAAGRSTLELRRCGKCRAEFRTSEPESWTLAYLDPDWFHRSSVLAGALESPLLKTRRWEEWPGALAGAEEPSVTLPPDAFGLPQGLAPGENVRWTFGPARVVTPQTHTPQHRFGPTGAVWITDRSLRVEVEDFRWSVPLLEITSVRVAGGVVEVTSGNTEEPLHLLVPQSALLARETGRARKEGPV